MKTLALAFVLLLAGVAFAQQEPTHPPVGPPPHESPLPPTAEQNPSQMPPDGSAPATAPATNADVQRQIQKRISEDPSLAQANVSVSVDDHGVLLTGTVDTESQHQAVLEAAQAVAGDRPIDDKIQIRSKA
jgi:hypothetical protein